mgnify:CR=1 FL=1
MMYDLGIYGNCSQDYITNQDGIINKTPGGSLTYISVAAIHVTNKKIISIGKMSTQMARYLNEQGINTLSQETNDISFYIDENKNTCIGKNYDCASFKVENNVDLKFLHVSFREGVDIEGFLCNPNVKYDFLSIDVTKFSAKKMAHYIQKYHDKVKILFCNIEEYELIKETTIGIPLILVTNEDKYVKIITSNTMFLCDVLKKENIISSTGAGDSFIGGFLGEYIISKDLEKSVKSGIMCAYYSLDNFGPLARLKENDFSSLHFFKPPNNLIVIGNSCAGKTTFINHFLNYVGSYTLLDDFNILKEVFLIEDLLANKKYEDFFNYEKNIEYIHEIYYEHKHQYLNPNYYTTLSKTGGHDIIRTELWDYIIKLLIKNTNQYNIIEFARGKNCESESEDPYDKSLDIIIQKINNADSTLIIYLVADFEKRKQRNKMRYQKSGHYVSDITMDTIYNKECFTYNKMKHSKKIQNKHIPVWTIINDIENINDQIWNKEIQEILLFYEKSKE